MGSILSFLESYNNAYQLSRFSPWMITGRRKLNMQLVPCRSTTMSVATTAIEQAACDFNTSFLLPKLTEKPGWLNRLLSIVL